MYKILQKVDRIRASGRITLSLDRDSKFYKYSGKTFKVISMGTPDYKCRITIEINGRSEDFTLSDIE